MHGAWVRLKDSTLEGRIAYYDKDTKLVWVVWDMGKYMLGKHSYKMKQPSASGHSVDKLLYLSRYEHSPWWAERS